jgi:hypothetical protein
MPLPCRAVRAGCPLAGPVLCQQPPPVGLPHRRPAPGLELIRAVFWYRAPALVVGHPARAGA